MGFQKVDWNSMCFENVKKERVFVWIVMMELRGCEPRGKGETRVGTVLKEAGEVCNILTETTPWSFHRP